MAEDKRQDAVNQALREYIAGGMTAEEQEHAGLGQAQLARAAALGDAQIKLAQDRAQAAKNWREAINKAEADYAPHQSQAALGHFSAAVWHQAHSAIAAAIARTVLVSMEQTAHVNRVDREGIAAVEAARQKAKAEVVYQLARAGEIADRLADLAAASGATSQQQFDAVRAAAHVLWIQELAGAPTLDGPFVNHARFVAWARAYSQPKLLAMAWQTRANSREDAQYQFTVKTAYLQAALAEANAGIDTLARSASEGSERTRALRHTAIAGWLEVKLAEAEKARGVATAAVEKKFQLASLAERQEAAGGGYGFAFWDSRAEQEKQEDLAGVAYHLVAGWTAADLSALGEGLLTPPILTPPILGTADAQLQFQKSEASSRWVYSQNLAIAEKQRAFALADRAKLAASGAALYNDPSRNFASYQRALDAALAAAEEKYWLEETQTAGRIASEIAMWDVNFQMLQNYASVTAAEAIDAALDDDQGDYDWDLPWTDYLVAEAQAYADWWSGTTAWDPANEPADAYLQWVTDRQVKQNLWQIDVNVAHAQMALDQRTATYNEAMSLASAEHTRATALATARYNYLIGPDASSNLLAAGKTYIDAAAQAERDYAVNVAQAQRDLVVNEDHEQYETALQTAADTKKYALETAENTYSSAEASKLSTRLTTEAGARYTYVGLVAGATKTRHTASANALYDYQVADAEKYVWVTTQLAQVDKDYALWESASLRDMAEDLATSTYSASPWATYYAGQMAVYDDWMQSAAPAHQAHRVALATAQARGDTSTPETPGGEIALAAAERDVSISAANSRYSRAMTITTATRDLQLAEANKIASGNSHKAALPALEAVDVSSSRYGVGGAPASDYVTSASTAGCFGWSYVSCGWWGGYFGYTGYYDAYAWWGGFGYGPYYYDTFGYWGEQVSAFLAGVGANLSEPAQVVLPGGFWNLGGQSQSVVDGDALADSTFAWPRHYDLALPQPATKTAPVAASDPAAKEAEEALLAQTGLKAEVAAVPEDGLYGLKIDLAHHSADTQKLVDELSLSRQKYPSRDQTEEPALPFGRDFLAPDLPPEPEQNAPWTDGGLTGPQTPSAEDLIAGKMAQFDPTKIPPARIESMIKAGRATKVKVDGTMGPKEYVVIADQLGPTVVVYVLESYVRRQMTAGRRYIDKQAYRLVAQNTIPTDLPGATLTPSQVLATVTTPKRIRHLAEIAYHSQRTQQVSGKQAREEFFFRLIPTASAQLDYADYQVTGDNAKLVDAGMALAGDVALVTGVGAAGKAGTGAKIAMRTGQVVEVGIAVTQGSRAIADFLRGDTDAAIAHGAEATLMLIGFSAAEIVQLRKLAKAKAAASGVPVPGKPVIIDEPRLPPRRTPPANDPPSGTPPSGVPTKAPDVPPLPRVISDRTHPTGPRGGTPTGNMERTPRNAPAEVKRGLARQKESADILANAGYRVEHRPAVPGPKRPDFRIQGRVFDNYAPTTTDPRSIISAINKKVGEGQASRIVLNLADTPSVTRHELREALEKYGSPDLQELIVIDAIGNIIRFYP